MKCLSHSSIAMLILLQFFIPVLYFSYLMYKASVMCLYWIGQEKNFVNNIPLLQVSPDAYIQIALQVTYYKSACKHYLMYKSSIMCLYWIGQDIKFVNDILLL